MRIERLSFFVTSVQLVPEGWRLVGVILPQDYKRFINSYGAGLVDSHITPQ
ncbi:SMI1/KNR4 family protein [Salinispora cortesiana]|uniref:SMI1/KNR4 family protein n=1 Tax=Salinispora cortesiana TaxID=1305843 RepID=UPI001FE020DD|nr:SMI1/KNR4 family protein [Salinispora cortesiana]